jgi:transcriptional regulator with XRE-family HTH domain
MEPHKYKKQGTAYMDDSKLDEQNVRQRIASNLIYYRKLNNMTQTELAERINYSDKSVSKWECASGVPDIFVLALLADLYGISVDDFLDEKGPEYQPPASTKNTPRFIIFLLSAGIAWLTATIVFTALRLFVPSLEKSWLAFIFAIPVSCIIAVVFSALWWRMLPRLLSVSSLVWSLALCIHLTISMKDITLIYTISAAMQVLVLLWFLLQKKLKGKGR